MVGTGSWRKSEMAAGLYNGKCERSRREQCMRVAIRDKPTGFIRIAWVKHIVRAVHGMPGALEITITDN